MITTLKAKEVAQAVLAAAASKLEQGKSVEEDLLEVDEDVELEFNEEHHRVVEMVTVEDFIPPLVVLAKERDTSANIHK